MCYIPDWAISLLPITMASIRPQRIYRDKIYIIKDIILKLVQYGTINQTALISCCGLNFKKHSPVLENLESKGLISKTELIEGKRIVTVYRPTWRGIEFCKSILEPYEVMFPRIESVSGEKAQERYSQPTTILVVLI
jgi:predicted transcriptional regulator